MPTASRGAIRKDQRREEAQERQEKHDALTPKQKLAKLDKKLGKNVGAVKERAKLQKEIESGA